MSNLVPPSLLLSAVQLPKSLWHNQLSIDLSLPCELIEIVRQYWVPSPQMMLTWQPTPLLLSLRPILSADFDGDDMAIYLPVSH